MSVSITIQGADFANDENGQFVQYMCKVDRDGEELSVVSRRFRDFQAFDDSWRKLYPNIQIKLPPTVFFGRTSQKTVSDRKVSLTQYLRNVAEIRSIRPMIAGFLGVQPAALNELKPKFQQGTASSRPAASVGSPTPRPAPAGAMPIGSPQLNGASRGIGPTPATTEICNNCGVEASGKFCQECGYKLVNKPGARSSSTSSSSNSTVSGGGGRSFGSANNGSPGTGGRPFVSPGRGGFAGRGGPPMASRGPPVAPRGPPVPAARGRGGGFSGSRTPPLPGPKPNLLNSYNIQRQSNNQSAPPLPTSPKPSPYSPRGPPRPAGGAGGIVIVGDNFKNPEYLVGSQEFQGDIYGGSKMRRRKSFMIAATKDYLQIAQNVMVTRQYKQNGDHHCIFSDTALVYDPRFKSSKRVLMLTDTSIYLLSPGTLTSKLHMPISDVRGISLSTMADHFFVISSRSGKPDQMIMCPRKTEFLVALRFRTERIGTQRNRLDLSFSDDISVTLKPNVVSVVMFRQKANSYDESINLQVMNRGVVPGASISVGVPQNMLADVNRDLAEQARVVQQVGEQKALERSASPRSAGGVGSSVGGFIRGVHQRVNSFSRGSSGGQSTQSAPPTQQNFGNSGLQPPNRSASSPNGFGSSSPPRSPFQAPGPPKVFNKSNSFSDSASVASAASTESDMNEDGKMMDPMTGNKLLDLYRGQKPHRRTSVQMDYKKYYLSNSIQNNLQTMISGNEPGENEIMFGDTVFKINRRDQKQKRILLLSNKAIYVLQVSTQAIARRIPLSTVERISVSKRADHWLVIHVFAQHDLVVMCPRKTELLIAAMTANPKLKIRCTNRIQYDLKTRDIKFILFGNFGGKLGDFDFSTNSNNKAEIMVSFQFPSSSLATKSELEALKNK